MANENNNNPSLITVLLVSAFFALTLFVFGPAYIYFTNSLEFNFSFTEIAPWFIGAGIGLTALLSAVLWFFRSRLYQKGAALLLVLSVLMWIQGNLLVWNYGPLDGRDIYWGKMWLKGLLDGGLWVLLIILALKKSAWFVKAARNTSIAFLAIQLISVSMAVMKAPETPSFKKYYIDESQKYSFSSKQNVIVLMLDTFQSDLFQQIINEEPKYKETFRGFTFFRNAMAAFPKTYTSVPSFMTAHAYDNTIPMGDFLEKAYNSDSSLPRRLKEAGFRVELYPFPHTEKTIHFDDDIASNIKKRESSGVIGQDFGFLVDITLFRHIPHFTKRFVYNDQAWLLKRLFAPPLHKPEATPAAAGNKQKTTGQSPLKFSKEALRFLDVKFIHDLLTQASVDSETPVFKYYHLNGLHRPLVLDEKFNVKKMPYKKRSSFKSQGKACLEIARLMLETLKKKGIFDQSLVLVVADHGCADYPYGVNIKEAGFEEEKNGSGQSVPSHIKASGLPMILIKPVNAPDQELKTTDAPVSLTDLPPTIAASLGIELNMPGTSMFDVPETGKRERTFYYYNWNGWGDGFLYHMREYKITGHSWLDSSWQTVGIKQPATAQKIYEYGTPIHFGTSGNAMRYQGIGWHGPQKNGFTWTREKKVELFFTVKPPEKDIVLAMTLKPYLVPNKLKKQQVTILVNNQIVKTLELTKRKVAEYKVTIPKHLVKGTNLNILFDIPTATAPVDLNIGTDVRTLGIALKSLTLR
jgi:hypothetical protein